MNCTDSNYSGFLTACWRRWNLCDGIYQNRLDFKRNGRLHHKLVNYHRHHLLGQWKICVVFAVCNIIRWEDLYTVVFLRCIGRSFTSWFWWTLTDVVAIEDGFDAAFCVHQSKTSAVDCVPKCFPYTHANILTSLTILKNGTTASFIVLDYGYHPSGRLDLIDGRIFSTAVAFLRLTSDFRKPEAEL